MSNYFIFKRLLVSILLSRFHFEGKNKMFCRQVNNNVQITLLYYFLWVTCIFTNPNLDIIKVDNFESYKLGSVPWYSQTKKYSKQVYSIKSESYHGKKNKYLQAKTAKYAEFLAQKINIDIVKYPFLNWKWRANHLPIKGDESVRKFCDASASVYVVLSMSKIKPRTMKYTWSTTLSKDTITKSPFAFWPAKCDIVVLQSGPELKGQWIREKRNILKDYHYFYPSDKKIRSKMIPLLAIMSDGDSTGTLSAADYDDIYFSRK